MRDLGRLAAIEAEKFPHMTKDDVLAVWRHHPYGNPITSTPRVSDSLAAVLIGAFIGFGVSAILIRLLL